MMRWAWITVLFPLTGCYCQAEPQDENSPYFHGCWDHAAHR